MGAVHVSRAEELLREVQELLRRSPHPPESEPEVTPDAGDRVVEPETEPPPGVVPGRTTVHRAVRSRRTDGHPPPGGRGTGRVIVAVVLVAALVAAGAAALLILAERDGVRRAGEPTDGPLPAQRVVTWLVRQEQPPVTFVTVLAAAEGLEPVAVGVPAHTIVSIPGQGTGTIGEAAAGGDARLVGTTVSSLLNVEVDASVATTLDAIGGLVDRSRGIVADGERMRGAAVVAYLRQRRVDPELRFLRWQEVLRALLPALAVRPTALQGADFPRSLGDVIVAVGASGSTPLELPVQEVGSGLAEPLDEEIERLVAEWFVPTAKTAGPVRLVVLNGNGIPGIGERVADVLIPAGFRLVSSQNAPTFDVMETQIVATDRSFLDEARLARTLLGVGRVALDRQRTAVADVAVVVGRDFRRA